MKHFADHAFIRHWVWISSLFIGPLIHAQDIAVGTWRTHFSYLNARILETTEEKVFCAVENGLFSYDIETQEVRRLSKIDGLSGAEISAMAYNAVDKVLTIGYSSGFIDLIYEDKIVNISDIFESNLEVGKTINAAATRSGEVLLGTDLGVIIIDLANELITENLFRVGEAGTQVEVLEIKVLNDELFVLTNEGIQSGNLNDNLLDFNNWITYPDTESFQQISLAGDALYAIANEELVQFQNGAWVFSGIELPEGTDKIKVTNDQLFAFGSGSIYQLVESNFELSYTLESPLINDIAILNNQFYAASGDNGLLNEANHQLSPTGPLSDTYSKISVLGNEVFGFHEGLSPSNEAYSLFSEGTWANESIEGFPAITDVVSFSGSRYFSSSRSGLYNEESNEIIDDIPGSSINKDIVLNALAADNYLWVVGDGDEPVHSMDAEGNWTSYESSVVFDTSFKKIATSESGIAWLLSDGGITVIDPEASQIETISASLPSGITDFTISNDDDAWVVSTNGPAFLPSASFVFFSQEAILPTFENRTLFEDQQVNTVITDGGNRVWFGTNDGLWAYDESISNQVAVFNQLNSPLPSNLILNLAYNGENGEIFIVTDKGMVSYRSASSEGASNHSNAVVFPNPVRPSYSGLVGISGLATDAILKITDINGNLVKELNANGGTASWDLRDENGGAIGTGIYFFFSASSDGEETFIGKIAILR